MTLRLQPETARLWIPHHSEASLQTWHCASKGYFQIATLHGPFESTKLSCLISIYGQGIVFWFLFIAFSIRESLYHAFMHGTYKHLIISAIFSLYRGTIMIFPPDYLEGESPRQSLIAILGAGAYILGSWSGWTRCSLGLHPA